MTSTVLLSDALDIDLLRAHIDDGVVGLRRHPSAPLHLYDYTPKAQYERVWTPVSMACRGLIVHDDGRLWARPFPKFFNAGEHGSTADGREQSFLAPLPVHEPFEVFDKLDGSLGIAYRNPVDGLVHISTRGSFASDQALHATELIRTRYPIIEHLMAPGQTWLFEIIYPLNRIVVDYGTTDDVVLLAILDVATGLDLPLPDSSMWPGPIVTRHATIAGWQELENASASPMSGSDGEGFVVRFASGVRAKLKFDDYLRLHRLVTGVSSVTVWENLSAGNDMETMLEDVPDEFFAWVRATVADLRAQFAAIEDRARASFGSPLVRLDDRKATAAYFMTQPDRAVLFKMFDSKSYDNIIWQQLRPAFARPFRVPEDG
jgi:hypothetical protein